MMTEAATCRWCEEPMDGRPCTGKPLKDTAVVEGVSYYRVPYEITGRFGPDGRPQSCHDCAAPQGGLHHPGCDMERCPRCLGQAISCGCRWDGDAPDPDFNPRNLEPEAAGARRATP